MLCWAFSAFILLPLKAIVDLVISISLRLFLLSIIFQIKNLWDIVPAEIGDRFLSMLPPWHAYERACEYFIFTHGTEQVYTTVRNLKVFFLRSSLYAYLYTESFCYWCFCEVKLSSTSRTPYVEYFNRNEMGNGGWMIEKMFKFMTFTLISC